MIVQSRTRVNRIQSVFHANLDIRLGHGVGRLKYWECSASHPEIKFGSPHYPMPM